MYSSIFAFLSIFLVAPVFASESIPAISSGFPWGIMSSIFCVGIILGIIVHMIWIRLRKEKIVTWESLDQEVPSMIHSSVSPKIIPPIPMVGSSLSNNTADVLVAQGNIPDDTSELENAKNDLSDVLVTENITGDTPDQEVPTTSEVIQEPIEMSETVESHNAIIDEVPPDSKNLLDTPENPPVLPSSWNELLVSPEPMLELDVPPESVLLDSGKSHFLLDDTKQGILSKPS